MALGFGLSDALKAADLRSHPLQLFKLLQRT